MCGRSCVYHVKSQTIRNFLRAETICALYSVYLRVIFATRAQRWFVPFNLFSLSCFVWVSSFFILLFIILFSLSSYRRAAVAASRRCLKRTKKKKKKRILFIRVTLFGMSENRLSLDSLIKFAHDECRGLNLSTNRLEFTRTRSQLKSEC